MKLVEGTKGQAAARHIEKLENLCGQLEELKQAFAEEVESCEEDGQPERALDMLSEALESIDSAIDAARDAMDEIG